MPCVSGDVTDLISHVNDFHEGVKGACYLNLTDMCCFKYNSVVL